MRAELERIEQIERYLMDKLSQSDKANFEMELGNDAVLQSQVEFQENLMEGLQRMGLMHDAKNAYKLYRKRLWYKYFGIGLGVMSLGLLAVVLWSYNSINYCTCSENPQQYSGGEEAMRNDGDCVDTCSFTPTEITDVSISYYEDKKEETDFIPKQVDFQVPFEQVISEDIKVVDNTSNENLAQIIRPAFENVSEESNGTDNNDFVSEVDHLLEDDPFYYRLSEVPYTVMPSTKSKLLRYLLRSDRFWGRRSRNPRKNLGTILSSNNNEAYFDAAKKKRKRLMIGDTPTEYVVNKELKMDSASMEPYFVYDTIPAGMSIPSLRVKGKNSNRNWVNWEIEAVEIDSVYIDIVFNVSQRENSYIYSIKEESEFNMPTQFLFRNVSGEYNLVGDVREYGMETFDKEENYDSEGPVCHSVGSEIQFRQRVKMKSDSASILINYAYMVCALGVSTQYPVEDSIILSLGWNGGKGGKSYRAIKDDLGDTTTSKILCPNTFTPNGDGVNEYFAIDHKGLKEFSISIYDKTGDVAFKSSNPNFKWDGRNKGGLLLADGTYNYHINATGIDEKPYDFDGKVYIHWQEKTENKEPVNPDATDVEPLFPGGEAAMFKWLNNEMDLSQLEGDGTVSGTIIVDYTVSETGKVTDIVIREGLTPELDQHVINVFKRMPDWSPGRVDGEPVSVYFSLPVVINNF